MAEAPKSARTAPGTAGVSLRGRDEKIGAKTLERLLAKAPRDASGRRVIESVQFEAVTLEDPAPLAGISVRKSAVFRSVSFNAIADFSAAVFAGDTVFAQSTFRMGARFLEATFEKLADFGLASFQDIADFSAAVFSGDTQFSQSSFDAKSIFRNVRFAGLTYFEEVEFAGSADFTEAAFTGYSRFDGSRFVGAATFDGTRFAGDTNFDGAKFQGWVNLAATFESPQVQAKVEEQISSSVAGRQAREPFAFAARTISDLPTEEDVLGFSPLVEGLRALLNVRRTKLPLAIAITAPWGAGKSSIMLQLHNALRHPGDRQPQERKWWTVRFDAWKYERSERLWAALAKAIYEQPQEQMGLLARVHFRMRVEQARLGWRRFLLKGVWPPVAAVVAVAGAIAADLGPGGSDASIAALLSSAVAFSAGVARYWGVASKPFKRAMERYASAPDYEGQLGFTAEADNDIKSLTRVLAPDSGQRPQALAVFVDDLDRCSSGHVVEIVEAMNQIFNSDERHGCVFVLGIDREVVATSIEVVYRETVESLKTASSAVSQDFGMNFLAKLVQLSVAIPEPTDEAIKALLSHITGNPEPLEETAGKQEQVQEAEEEIRRQAPETLEEVAEASSAVESQDRGLDPKTVAEAQRRIRAELIRDSDDVVKAEFEVLQHLDRNPRQIKRFDNAFRLQLYVANEDPRCRLDFSLDQLVALGKWVALRLRWPDLAEALDDEPSLTNALEAAANEDAPPLDATEFGRLKERYSRWFVDPSVLELLRENAAPARRLSNLERDSFMRVA